MDALVIFDEQNFFVCRRHRNIRRGPLGANVRRLAKVSGHGCQQDENNKPYSQSHGNGASNFR
jgi:hypothetical protein